MGGFLLRGKRRLKDRNNPNNPSRKAESLGESLGTDAAPGASVGRKRRGSLAKATAAHRLPRPCKRPVDIASNASDKDNHDV
mmetsp:Transcript_11048/g.23970  ORF Transcript_11048/g.23970 Transcript_11048/m.23970 type:complete len:82 (-) Transcript_11048:17-262(-)